MRTRQQSQFRYNGLTTREFGERTGQSPEQVRTLIAGGWFGWTEGGTVPECLDVSSEGSKQPTWRIHVNAVKRFYQERAAPSAKK